MSGIILVTGAAGHLGEALVRTLRAAGREVRGLDRVASPCTDVVASIADRGVVERCMDGVDAVIHAATLHKPHVATHSRQAFVDTNITGTLNLLEAAVRAGVRAFLYTSTTSAFGDALVPPAGAPAAWITEDVVPVPKNIYGVTKVAAEDLCALAHRNQGLPCLVLRTSRFFPEADDDPAACARVRRREPQGQRVPVPARRPRGRRRRAPAARSSAPPRWASVATSSARPRRSRREDPAELRRDAPAVIGRRVPGWQAVYARLGWRMAPSIDRVYDNARARADLGWRPRHDFASVLARAREDGEIRSPLARTIGAKGYHGERHAGGLDPVRET